MKKSIFWYAIIAGSVYLAWKHKVARLWIGIGLLAVWYFLYYSPKSKTPVP